VRTTQPGLHWKMPLNIETLDKVKVRFPYKEEFGFRTLSAGINTKYSNQRFDDESIMLTGDLNVLNVTWTVEFKIKDPVQLLFNVKNPAETVRDISESVMRQSIGDSSVSEALTTRRNQINQEVQEQLQNILDSYEAGIQIETVKLQDVNPPDVVKKSFNEVNEAKQEKERTTNEAWESYNKAIPRAKGQAAKTISEAEGYASAKISKAEGDANKFLETWGAYKEAKDVTRSRMYLETMEEVLPRAGNIYVFEPKANSILPLLNLTGGSTHE
ncbi:MAG: membrane protease subunit HflK, partial [Lysobacterales bacterium]